MKVNDIISAMFATDSKPKVAHDHGKPAEFSNKPDENYIDVKTIMSQGDDVNKPKNPADIRSNSISMYPSFQAEKK